MNESRKKRLIIEKRKQKNGTVVEKEKNSDDRGGIKKLTKIKPLKSKG